MKLSTCLSGTVPLVGALLLAGSVAPRELGAQGLNWATVSGTITDRSGVGVPNALLTFRRAGGGERQVTATLRGVYQVSGLVPGEYSVLVEQVGYQPVRVTGIVLPAGTRLRVSIELDRRPPPIESVEERIWSGAGAGGAGSLISAGTLSPGERWRESVAGFGGLGSVVAPADRRYGGPAAAGGLRPGLARLMVDGVEESLLRHPGHPGESGAAPIFAVDGTSQIGHLGNTADVELPSAPGGVLGIWSRSAPAGSRFEPYLDAGTASGRDSSAVSIRGGIAAGGTFRGDSAGWTVRADYRQLATPGYAPFEYSAVPAGEPFGAGGETAAGLAPVVRRWTGGSVNAGMSWNFSGTTRLAGRVGLASWREEAPALGRQLVNGSGVELEASDLSAALEFSTGGEEWTSDTRFGIRVGSRDWTVGGTPFTGVVVDALAIGAPTGVAGSFDERAFQIAETATFVMGAHRLKVGGSIVARTVNWDWLVDGGGRAWYGSFDELAAGRGSWLGSAASSPARDIGTTELSAFAQDNWELGGGLSLIGGVRYTRESLPADAVRPNEGWITTSAIFNYAVPSSDAGSVAPRAELVWRPGDDGSRELRLAGGMVTGSHDIAALAEAARYDGSVTVNRIVGVFDRANPGGGAGATPLTMFSPEVRRPLTSFLAGSWSMAVGAGTTLTLGGSYRHTDYLPIRTDLNRHATRLATMQDGRPVWGEMENLGGLVVPAVGSNRRFEEFDRAMMITSGGYADHYEAGIAVAREMGKGLRIAAGYTFSRTEDNLLNQLSPDPVDRISPFAGDAGTDSWLSGRSDLDVPHRLTMSARWESERIAITARGRWQSGLPFTPGFQQGVDINGDGSSANDPVASGAVSGLSQLLADAGCSAAAGDQFASRNGCREPSLRWLDLHGEFRITGTALLGVSVVNIGAGSSGVVDRAAVKVDPSGSIGRDAQGRLVMPLILNENFGRVLSRRNDPLMLRVGIRLEN